MHFFLVNLGYQNLIVLCFSFNSFMSVIKSAFVPFHIINMLSIYLSYSRDIFFNVWIDVFCFKVCYEDVRVRCNAYCTHGTAHYL